MNIYYIVNARMPTEKAHGYQIAKMCETFAFKKNNVSLIVPTRKNVVEGNIFAYYGVRNVFTVTYISTFDALTFFRASRFAFYIQAISFLWALRNKPIPHDTIIITRNPEIVWWYGRKGYRIFYDAHNFPVHGAWFLKVLLKNTAGIIANSVGTSEAFRHAGFTNVLTAPNAVDLAQFDNTIARKGVELGLPLGRIAMYVGHLYEWKGIEVVINAARRSKIEDLTFVFVGGTDNDLARYRKETKNLKNIIFLGRRLHHEIPALIKSAHVLLLPNIPSTRESMLYTSPIKMFEYMASGVPIVASDLPSIREILSNKNAILVKAGDPDALLHGIAIALNSGYPLAMQAQKDVRAYSWNLRAEKILKFINDRI
jgi:glycosyltransferase involved in cell wall biosynthesis